MTLRARLLAGLVVVLVTLAGALVVVAVVQRNYVIGQLDDQLEALAPNARVIVTRLSTETGRSVGPGVALTEYYVGRITPDGELVTLVTPSADPEMVPDVSNPSALTEPGTRPTTSGVSARARVLVTPLPDGSQAVFAASQARANASSRRLTAAIALAGAVIVTVLGLVVWWVIRLGLRPIRAITDAADAITAGAGDRRVEAGPEGTEAARLADAFNTMIDTNQAADGRLRQFVADASHELRTPLTTLRGYASLRAAGGLTDDAAVDDAMRRMGAEAARMARIVDDLLLLAELDEHGSRLHDRVDLAAVLEDLASDLRVVQPDRSVVVDAPTPVVVLGDRDQLVQAVAALTGNALRYTPTSAGLELRARALGEWARVEVTDRGPGIDPAELPRLFDRFYRGGGEGRSAESGGSGLGLAIVASITAAHGGHHGAVSEPGRGSTFWIDLPTADGQPPGGGSASR